MRATKRQPASVGEMLQQEFLVPLGITAQDLAKAMGVHRNTISNLKRGGTLTVPLAIKLAKALGNSPEFWMNIQHAVDLWETRNSYQKFSKDVTPLIPPTSTL